MARWIKNVTTIGNGAVLHELHTLTSCPHPFPLDHLCFAQKTGNPSTEAEAGAEHEDTIYVFRVHLGIPDQSSETS